MHSKQSAHKLSNVEAVARVLVVCMQIEAACKCNECLNL